MKNIHHFLLCTAMLIVPASAVQAADFQTIMQQRKADQTLITLAPKTVPYSYIVTLETENQEDEDGESFYGQYRMDPSAQPGDRITFINGKLEDFPKDIQAELEKLNAEASVTELADDFWCGNDEDMSKMLTSDSITVKSENEKEVIISLGPEIIAEIMSDDEADGDRKMPKKIRKRMLGEITLSKPELHFKQSRIWLSRPTTMKVVAKMKEMKFEQSCELASNGFPYMRENTTRIAGKALGNAFEANVKITISDLQPN